MAIDVGATFCQIINADLDEVCLPLPGGGEICFHPGAGNIPTPPDICADLIPQIQLSLAMLAPLMCIIDVALAMLDVQKAIPDSLGPPPDPTELLEKLLDLIETAMCLLPLIPQLSICPLVKALLDIIINCLIDVRDQITNLVNIRVGIADGRSRSAELGGVALLDAALDCSEENASLLEAALGGGTAALQRMIDVTLNPLMEVAGLDPIEVDVSIEAGAPDEVIAALDEVILALFAIRDALPC